MHSVTITLFCLALVWAITYYVLKLFRSWTQLPPGPWGLPILGYLPFLDRIQPQRTLESLRAKYGKVFSIQMGRVTTVVLADPLWVNIYSMNITYKNSTFRSVWFVNIFLNPNFLAARLFSSLMESWMDSDWFALKEKCGEGTENGPWSSWGSSGWLRWREFHPSREKRWKNDY